MTEPVAYLAKSRKSGTVMATVNEWNYHDFENIPLYTKEQLQPKVQMTQTEFDEFHSLLSLGVDTPHEALSIIIDDRGEMEEFENLYSRLFTNDRVEQAKNQSDFSTLWVSLLGRNVKELVEIVPNMKWFVRSKKADNSSGHYHFRSGVKHFGDYYYTKDKNDNKKAYPFDTKEEAERWTNPLTEAVQLPVEGE